MLCVKKLTFIDRAEPQTLWTYNLKKQWAFGDKLAVRVHDANERVLGSTIPMPFGVVQEGHSEWRISWIEEEPEQPAENNGTASSAVSYETDATNIRYSPPAQLHEAPSENASAPSYSTDAAEGQEPPLPHALEQGVAKASSPATAAEGTAAAENGQSPSSSAAENAAGEANESADETGSHVKDGSLGLSVCAGAAVTTSAGATHSTPSLPSVTPPSEVNAAKADRNTSNSTQSAGDGTPITAHSSGSTAASPNPQIPVRRPSFSSCVPINIAQAAKGPLLLEVITVCGTKLAITEADVQPALREADKGSPVVQHYAILMTPVVNPKLKHVSTVYAVLEFSVVSGSTDIDAVISMSVNTRYSPLPTSLEVGDTCAISTRTFYFPKKFLTGTGDYIVSNVLCVESRSDNPVRVEVALPENLKKLSVLPNKKTVINGRGERVFFTFTWNISDTFVELDTDKSSDVDSGSIGIHVLIRDGTENKAPVDIALLEDLPPPKTECTDPFMFYVNHARVSNIASSGTDDAILADILPIALVTRARV